MARNWRPERGSLLSCAALLALAACGGGGSSGGTATPPPVAAPAPTPSPAPAPTPTPAPSPLPPGVTPTSSLPLFFLAIGVSAQDASGGGRQISDAIDSGGTFQVKLGDADASSEVRYEDVTFDGDETFVVTNIGGIGAYNEDLLASDFGGAVSIEYQDGTRQLRTSPRLVWQSRRGSPDSAILILQELEEVRKTAASAPTTGNRPEHVRILELRVTNRRGIEAFGSRSAANAVPIAGTAVFVGEVFGNFRNSSNQLDEFVGDAVLNVDFARRSVTGRISVSQYLFNPTSSPPLQIEFSATISGETFEAQRVTVTGDNIIQGGTLRGAFFGEAVDEIGLVFSTSGASGSIIAGLAAGKE